MGDNGAMSSVNASRASAVSFNVVNDCEQRLHALTAKIEKYRDYFEAHDDAFAVFSSTYVDITAGLAETIASDPSYFENPEFIVRLAEGFAERYFDGMNAALALRSHVPNDPDFQRPRRAGVPPPLPWQDVARHAQSHRTLVLEDLFYGMMVHIGYDLPVVLSTMPLENPAFIRDFERFNEVLDAHIDVVEDDVGGRYGQGVHLADVLGGQVDEVLTAQFIRYIRHQALDNAKRLRSGDGDVLPKLLRNVERLLALSDMTGPLGSGLRLIASLTRRWP